MRHFAAALCGTLLIATAASAQTPPPASPAKPAAEAKPNADKPAADAKPTDAKPTDERPAAKKSAGKKTKAKKRSEPKAEDDATGADAPEAPALQAVTTAAKSLKLGLQYAASIRGSDHGLEHEQGGPAPKSTVSVGLRALRLHLTGELTPRTELAVALDPADVDDVLRSATVTWWASERFGLFGGKDLVAQGGYERKRQGYETVALSPYNEQWLPLAETEAMLGLKVKALGLVTLQIVQDRQRPKTVTTTADTAATTPDAADEPAEQPAVALEWAGTTGIFRPLLQAGSYDFGRSRWAGLGLGLELARLGVYVDYVTDHRQIAVARPGDAGGAERRYDEHTLVAVDTRLRLGAAHEVFLTVSDYAVAQPDDAKLGLTDRGYNSQADSAPVLDDDATTAALGLRLGAVERVFRPYLAVTRRSARFLDAKDPSATRERAETGWEVGVGGEL